MNFGDVRKIAVIRRNGFGDALCTIPLVLYCKKRWPKASVTLFLEEKTMCLAPYLVGPDRVVGIPRGRNKYFSTLGVGLRQRRERFDLAFSAKTGPMKLMNAFLFALGAKHRFAYTGKGIDSLLVNCKKEVVAGELHQAVQILRLIEPELMEIGKDLFPRLKGVGKKVVDEMPTLFFSVSNNRVGCSLGLERAAYLLNRLGEKHRFCTVINSLPQDLERGELLSSLLVGPKKVMPTARFADFLELINSCDGSFVGDGGACHLASALDKPVVALFGGTLLSQWRPLNESAICFSTSNHVDTLPEADILAALGSILETMK